MMSGCRFLKFVTCNFEILNDNFVVKHNLIPPNYLKSYEMGKLQSFRINKVFDDYRTDGFPDDVQVLLLSQNDSKKPELIWARVEEYNETDNKGSCNLIVQPKQKFGLKINENIDFSLKTYFLRIEIIKFHSLLQFPVLLDSLL